MRSEHLTSEDIQQVVQQGPFTNEAMDSCAQMIAYQIPNEVIKEGLLARGMNSYEAFLCYTAAKMLLRSGFYDRSSLVAIPPT